MARTTITGTVVRAEIKTRAPYDPYIGRYSPNTSYLEFYADLAIETETDTVYLKSPAVMRTVTNGGPFAVVCYDVKDSNKFLKEVGDNHVAQAGQPNDNVLELTIKEGYTVEISGRLKAQKVSKKGNPYRTLTHCKLENAHVEDAITA